MESKQSKFNLLDTMMSRLGVTPGMLTKEWLKNNAIPFVWTLQESSQKGVKMDITGKIVSAKLVTNNKVEIKPSTKTPKLKPSKSTKDKTDGQKETPASEGSLFYNPDWEGIDDEFNLNKETVSQLRCGMFAYHHGPQIIITKKKLSSQQEISQNYMRLGVVFDLQENRLLVLNLCVSKSSYAKAQKRLLAECRLLTGDECKKIFVSKELLQRGFEKMNVNLKDAKRVFFKDDSQETGRIGVFNFQKGKSTERSQETARADAYQVQTIKLKLN